MGHRHTCVAISAGILATAAHAADKWESVAEVPLVKIEVRYVTHEELTRLQRQYAGDRGDLRQMDNGHRHGLAVLFTHRETGERRCEIYVVSDGMSATRLAEVLGHEAAHCFGFTH